MSLLRTFLSFSLFAFIGSFAHADATKEQWISCKKTDDFGLFEQCESVKLLKNQGTHIRAYSVPNQQVLKVSADTLFQAEKLSSEDAIESGKPIMIPSTYLWQHSDQGFQTLCETSEDSNDSVLDINCGNIDRNQIHRTYVYQLTPHNEIYQKPSGDSPTDLHYSKK